MGDDFVQVAPDSTGKKIDNTSMVVGANTVYRQRVVVSDNANAGNHLAIDANGFVGVSAGTVGASTITAGTVSISAGTIAANTITAGTISVSAATITAGTMSNLTVVAMNAGTVTSSTITAALPAGTNVIGGFRVYDPNGNTAAVVTASSALKVDASATTQPVSFSAGTVSFSAGTVTNATITAGTIASATITAGTVGSATIVAGTVGSATIVAGTVGAATVTAATVGSATISAGTIGSATITAGTVSANQGTANATPWNENLAEIGGSTIAAVTKGVQTANAMPTQHYMDAGRTPVTFNADRVTGATAETALSVTINKNGTTSSASTYLITTGKTLHIQGVYWTVRATSTTLVSGRGRLRYAGSSVAPTTATALLLGVEASSFAAVAESTGPDNTELARGLELAGNTAIGFSHIESSTLSSISMNVIAFEY